MKIFLSANTQSNSNSNSNPIQIRTPFNSLLILIPGELGGPCDGLNNKSKTNFPYNPSRTSCIHSYSRQNGGGKEQSSRLLALVSTMEVPFPHSAFAQSGSPAFIDTDKKLIQNRFRFFSISKNAFLASQIHQTFV